MSNFSDRGYIEHVIDDVMPRHVTGQPGGKCKYCGTALPEDAIGNPTYPWKYNQGRGFSVFCTKNCMDWSRYRLKLKAFRNIPNVQKNRTEEQYIEALRETGEYPEGPDPLQSADETAQSPAKPSECAQDAPQTETEKDTPAAAEQPTGAAEPQQEAHEDDQHEEERHEEEAEPMGKKQLLKRTVREVTMEGEHIKVSVLNTGEGTWLESEGVSTRVCSGLIAELRELADSLEKTMGADE